MFDSGSTYSTRTDAPLLSTTAMPVKSSCVPSVQRIGVSLSCAITTPFSRPPSSAHRHDDARRTRAV